MSERLRLVDLLGPLSMVADHAHALAPGESMRASLLGAALARRAGLPEDQVGEAFFAGMLRHVGCVGFAHEMTALLGDDLQANAAGASVNFARPQEILTSLIPDTVRGRPVREQIRSTVNLVARGRAIGRGYETTSCEVGRATARRLGLADGVQRAVYEVHEWWDGGGHPNGVSGEQITVGARVARIAGDAVLFHRLGGPELAAREIQMRSGVMTDPELAALFVAEANALLAEVIEGDARELLLAAEPAPVAKLSTVQLVTVAEAFADLVDLKIPFMHGHSRGVAGLAAAAGREMRLDEEVVADLNLAGLLHDLGRVAVSNRIWEKPSALDTVEWEQVRLHPYHSERILSASEALGSIAGIVGAHHERVDGSGYHRGSRRRELTTAARVLAVADAHDAMTSPRPHRDALTSSAAADELAREAKEGRLDEQAVAAVLEVVGFADRRAKRTAFPAGLTPREAEVIGLVARGLSNPEVGEALTISKRTAEHHLQSAYTKVGVSTRAAITLFAMEHDLMPPHP